MSNHFQAGIAGGSQKNNDAGVSDASALARQIARSKSRPSSVSSPDPEIARLSEQITTPEQVAQTIAELRDNVNTRLDQAPRPSLDWARVAYGLASAKGDEHARAETALTLATALNRMGEFTDAYSKARDALALYTQLNDLENAAQSLCEGAWANTFIGDLQSALQDVKRASELNPSPLVLARCDWIQGRVLRLKSQFTQATELLEKTVRVLRDADLPGQAARCERDLATVRIFSQKGEALASLGRLRQWFESLDCALDAAQCDLVLSIGLLETNRNAEALHVAQSARQCFVDLGADFFVASCDRNIGIAYSSLSRYDESVQASKQARAFFSDHGIRADVSACDINLGLAYYLLNRYDEALEMYKEAADLVQGDGREARMARVYINMGTIHIKQGRFSEALNLLNRALQLAVDKSLPLLAAGCHSHLATCYRELGDYAQALQHEQQVKQQYAAQQQSRASLIHCNISLAEIHLANGNKAEALACLEQARSMAFSEGMDVYVAATDRLAAQVEVGAIDRHDVLAKIKNARRLFIKYKRFVDAALCDLVKGELHLRWNEIPAAQACFRRARSILSPAFPDQAWRAEYGLGLCADAANKHTRALHHHLRAVRTIAASRSALVTEQLSNDFFSRRQSVYDKALALGLNERKYDTAVEVIELSKARTFLTLVRERGWKSRQRDDPYLSNLIENEKQVRRQLSVLRRNAIAEHPKGDLLRGRVGDAAAASARKELHAKTMTYEAIATRLRLAMTGLAGVPAPLPFALDQFCDSANAALGVSWAALDYYLSGDELTIARVMPKGLKITRTKLSSDDRAILDKCTSSDQAARRLAYGETLRHNGNLSRGSADLNHLYHLLIPEDLDVETLIISPHGPLHSLPFHALVDEQGYLIEQRALVYTPSLQVLQHLFAAPKASLPMQSLVIGLADFGNRMPKLPWAGFEVESVLNSCTGEVQTFWADRATRRKLFELDAAGELQKYDLLHFATHAVLDPVAPHQSRIYLHDDMLTALDILELTLNARLVTLSACQTALGTWGRGDEALSLARAFFYAGARALLATLWQVEDETLVKLNQRFYSHWGAGLSAAQSLRKAAVEMIRAGMPPYSWAPLTLIGQP